MIPNKIKLSTFSRVMVIEDIKYKKYRDIIKEFECFLMSLLKEKKYGKSKHREIQPDKERG